MCPLLRVSVLMVACVVCVCVAKQDKEEGTSTEPEASNHWRRPGYENMVVPELTEEEKESPNLPTYMRCDGCRAIVYQLRKTFLSMEGGKKTKKKDRKALGTVKLDEAIEKACNADTYQDYGLSASRTGEHKGRLSGPGLPSSHDDVMMVMSGDGAWNKRMSHLCVETVGEVGEEVVYEAHWTEKGNPSIKKSQVYQTMCPKFCDDGTGKKKKSKKKKKGKHTEL